MDVIDCFDIEPEWCDFYYKHFGVSALGSGYREKYLENFLSSFLLHYCERLSSLTAGLCSVQSI